MLISKDEYTLKKIKLFLKYFLKENKEIDPLLLVELIKQWEFDYELEKEYRPEILIK